MSIKHYYNVMLLNNNATFRGAMEAQKTVNLLVAGSNPVGTIK